VVWKVSAAASKFAEAVSWFGNRLPVTDQLAAELGAYTGPRAFTIAGVTQLDVVNDVHRSLERAIADGIPFDEWKAEVQDKLTKAWGRKDSARIETIFINANQQAYNAGRWAQMTDPAVLPLRPFGFFDGVADSRQSPICRECDGTILPLSDPWWATHSPQLHHRCRSQIRTLRESDARRRGVTAAPPTKDADEGFGLTPTLSGWAPEPQKYPPDLWSEYQRKAAEIEASATRARVKANP
jgi:SPP1 gp7 family putative phage head morphogenesis protein